MKKLDPPGIEPGAFRLQSERDTTTPRTLNKKKEIPEKIIIQT